MRHLIFTRQKEGINLYTAIFLQIMLNLFLPGMLNVTCYGIQCCTMITWKNLNLTFIIRDWWYNGMTGILITDIYRHFMKNSLINER